MNVGIFLPNWLGDVVMATPTLRSLRHFLGRETRIVGIMRPYLADLLAGTDWLDEQWYLEKGKKGQETSSWSLVRRMRRERLELVVMLTNSLRPAVITYMAGVPDRIGYSRNGRSPLLTGKAYSSRDNGQRVPAPMVDYYLRLAELIGAPPTSRQLELRTTPEDEISADGVWQNLGLRDDGRVLLLNFSGAFGASKLWPVEHFGDLARRMVGELDHDVLVMCGPGEQETAKRIVALAGSPKVVSMAEQPMDFGTAKACIGRGRLMVSTDSGPRHVAAAMGKPVVTLFGPMMPVWSENPTIQAKNLVLDLDCIGCGKRECPLGHHKCMQDLSCDRVFWDVASMLKETRKLSVA